MYDDHFALVEDTVEFFAPVATDAIAHLVAAYNAKRDAIIKLAQLLSGEYSQALGYFLQASDQRSEFLLRTLNVERTIESLDAEYWSKALALTDVMSIMPAARRKQWNEQIMRWRNERPDPNTPPLPTFTDSVVRDLIGDLLSKRPQLFAERIDGLFQSLSGGHLTNAPSGFSKRMILSGCFNEYGHVSNKSEFISDLRVVIAKFRGQVTEYRIDSTVVLRLAYKRRGEWIPVDGGAFRIRAYHVGTVHIEIHPEFAWRLNQALALLYPQAIPPQFRRRSTKPLKKHELLEVPLSFELRSLLGTVKHHERPTTIYCPQSRGEDRFWKQAEAILLSLGGEQIFKSMLFFSFDYDPLPVIQEIVVTGTLPDKVSHQFYPTNEVLARHAVDLLEARDEDEILEPSAGQGGLAELLPKEKVTCVEISKLHCVILRQKGYRHVFEADFLEWADARKGTFPRILMNPPYKDGQWKTHLRAAASLLSPGGRLVAILPASATRAAILPAGFSLEWHGPFENQFDDTGVAVRLLVAVAPT